jgi:hypothetical protein
MEHLIECNKDFLHSAFVSEKPSDEWFSKRDIAENYRISINSAQSRLETQVLQGKLEKKVFNVMMDGIRRRVNYYRLKT